MAGLSAFDGRIRRRSPKPWPWFVAGLVVGAAVGWGAPKLLDRTPDVEPEQRSVVEVRPTPVPLQTLRIIARPGRGMSLVAAGPLKLEGAGDSNLSEQKEQGVFVGLRNWDGTMNYLVGGQAKLFLRDGEDVVVSGGWKENDYRRFARGQQPLQVKVKSGATYTLYFQRSGSTPIDLGKFSAGRAAVRATIKPVATTAGD